LNGMHNKIASPLLTSALAFNRDGIYIEVINTLGNHHAPCSQPRCNSTSDYTPTICFTDSTKLALRES
jgi:hypothetical protein